MKERLILASQSRGRRALLSLLKIPFEVIPSTLDEDAIIGKTPLASIKLRAKLKGEEVVKKVVSGKLSVVSEKKLTTYNLQPTTILSSDSGAILDGQLIGKPKDYNDAVKILKTLSGRRHEFVTAVYMTKIIPLQRDLPTQSRGFSTIVGTRCCKLHKFINSIGTINNKQKTKNAVAKQDEIFADRISSASEKSYMDGRSGLRRARVAEQENFICEQRVSSFIARSYVTFKKLTPFDIRTYLSHTHYTRYAGAYALFICPKCPRPGLADLLSERKYHDLLEKTCIPARHASLKLAKSLRAGHTHLPNLIESIEGSLSNVIGLPLEKLIPYLVISQKTLDASR